MDREEIINDLEYLTSEDCTDTQFDYIDSIQGAIAFLKEQPQIVRCKNCEHYDKDMIYCNKFGIQSIDGDWFCADGKRKEGR